MNFKKRIWKYITLLIVMSLLLNPETIFLGLFIDAVSLETFLLLVEVQAFAIAGFFIQTKIKPALAFLNKVLMRLDPYYFIPSKAIIIHYPPIILHAIPALVGLYWVLFFQVW